MFHDKRVSYLWGVLAAAVLVASIIPPAIWIDQMIGNSDIGRWVHFLSYAAIIVIPFAGCRKRKGVVLALLVIMGGIILQSLEMLIPGWLPRPQNIVANMFGVGAGILLGVNLRMMRSQAKPDRSLRINSPHSPRI